MTKQQALMQSLLREDKSDWLIADFLNLEVVDDAEYEFPVLVQNLSEEKAKIALGITINYIKQKNKKLKKIIDIMDLL